MCGLKKAFQPASTAEHALPFVRLLNFTITIPVLLLKQFRQATMRKFTNCLPAIRSGIAGNACHAKPGVPGIIPRALLIMALRHLAMKTGLFTASEKGRQQLVIKRSIGEWILKYGYCVYREELTMEDHPEQGPTWEWQNNHLPDLLQRLGIEYKADGPGVLRKIPEEALDELRSIFGETGGMDFLKILRNALPKRQKKWDWNLINGSIVNICMMYTSRTEVIIHERR